MVPKRNSLKGNQGDSPAADLLGTRQRQTNREGPEIDKGRSFAIFSCSLVSEEYFLIRSLL